MVIHLSNASMSAPWKVPVLEGAIRSRAAENGMFVVSANDARTPQMMVSAVCDPDGRDLARAPENEEALIYAELDRRLVKTDYLEARRLDLWNRPVNRAALLG
jgi:predicted amidohydrolase